MNIIEGAGRLTLRLVIFLSWAPFKAIADWLLLFLSFALFTLLVFPPSPPPLTILMDEPGRVEGAEVGGGGALLSEGRGCGWLNNSSSVALCTWYESELLKLKMFFILVAKLDILTQELIHRCCTRNTTHCPLNISLFTNLHEEFASVLDRAQSGTGCVKLHFYGTLIRSVW